MARTDGLEIERKWLLAAAPSPAALSRLGATSVTIEQVYLASGSTGASRRIRWLREAEGEAFVLTEKSGHGATRRERESAIDRAAYTSLLGEADPGRRPIRKVRHRIPHGSHTIELDVFTDPPDLVVMEVEVGTADEAIAPWPRSIASLVVREVTDERSYENAELARIEPGPDVTLA